MARDYENVGLYYSRAHDDTYRITSNNNWNENDIETIESNKNFDCYTINDSTILQSILNQFSFL